MIERVDIVTAFREAGATTIAVDVDQLPRLEREVHILEGQLVAGAGLVGLRIQGKKSPHHLVWLRQDAFVHPLPERGELERIAAAAPQDGQGRDCEAQGAGLPVPQYIRSSCGS